MPEPLTPFLERLLEQDTPPSAQRQKEYHMQLELALTRATKMERRARWTMIALWAAVYLNLLWIFALVQTIGAPAPAEWWGILQTVLIIAAAVETVFYFARYRPALSSARNERQMQLLLDLERKLAELTRRLDERG